MANTQKKKRLAIALARNQGKWIKNHDLASQARVGTSELGGLLRALTRNGVVERRLLTRQRKIRMYVSEYRCNEGDVSRLLEGLNGHLGTLTAAKAWYGEALVKE